MMTVGMRFGLPVELSRFAVTTYRTSPISSTRHQTRWIVERGLNRYTRPHCGQYLDSSGIEAPQRSQAFVMGALPNRRIRAPPARDVAYCSVWITADVGRSRRPPRAPAHGDQHRARGVADRHEVLAIPGR